MKTIHTRAVDAARGWLGTRFCHQGRLKRTVSHKGGVDCLGLLAGVADELRLCIPNGTPLIRFDEHDYSHYPDGNRLHILLSGLLNSIVVDDIHPGSVLLFRLDKNPQHLAIVSDWGKGLGLIHAYAPAKAVVEHELTSWWLERVAFAYQIKQQNN